MKAAPCPICGAPAPSLLVYKHRWRACAACGNASREDRASLPLDRLPAPLRARLPVALRRGATPSEGAFFADPPSPEALAAEADRFDQLLGRLEIQVEGDVLEIGGGPGAVAERLRRRGCRPTLLEHAEGALGFARERLGLDARPYDFAGAPLPAVAPGPYDWLICRFALGWCRDLPKLARGLAAVARPGARALLCFVLPTRGAALMSALEDHAPAVLWSAATVERVFAEAGFQLLRRFEPIPPLPFWAARGPRYRALSAPWALRPGPLPPDPLQRHAGLLLVYAGPTP